ncbi:MAG: GMC family oxidoreductase [Actinomycetota bacterium]|nr:GMC family oxidoreductase [Actinomycetota bacterium]
MNSAPAGSDPYDVIVIGSGPGGGSTAAKLAETGKRVLLLERGDYLPRERGNWDSEVVFGQGRYTADETFYDIDDNTFHPELHYFVGGNSKVYGAALFRLQPSDFGDVRHPGGIAPAWPISYSDLEPYYVQAEHLYWVHGLHGEDPFAGPASQDYKYPPVQHAPRIQELSDDLTQLGLHPFHLPIGVDLTQDADGNPTPQSRCIRCDRVDGFPCLVGAKADAEWAVIRPALAAHDNLTMLTRATVQKLITGPDGRTVTGVLTELSDGSQLTFTADIVVLSAGSILSSVLLLRSANEQHPHGLANSSDVVGRHYMRHNNLALMAFSKDRNPTVFQKTLSLNDFYGPSKYWEYPMGNIQMLGKSDDWQVKGQAPKGLGWAPNLPYGIVAAHSLDFWLASEDLPLPDSRVTLRPDGSVKLAVQPDNNSEGLTRLRHTFDSMLNDLGMQSKSFERSLYLHKAMDVSATAHQAGTVRFGTNPRTAALDINCKAHDLDNLYVIDGSFMPSIGAVNPTLTIIANALRVAEHITARLA